MTLLAYTPSLVRAVMTGNPNLPDYGEHKAWSTYLRASEAKQSLELAKLADVMAFHVYGCMVELGEYRICPVCGFEVPLGAWCGHCELGKPYEDT